MLLSDYIRRLQLKLDIHGDREVAGARDDLLQANQAAISETGPTQHQSRRLAAYKDIQNIERRFVPSFQQCVE